MIFTGGKSNKKSSKSVTLTFFSLLLWKTPIGCTTRTKGFPRSDRLNLLFGVIKGNGKSTRSDKSRGGWRYPGKLVDRWRLQYMHAHEKYVILSSQLLYCSCGCFVFCLFAVAVIVFMTV